ncbi:MAG: 4-hydroxy-tetrahydrodipicolinate reductase [Chitinophagales bacterium]
MKIAIIGYGKMGRTIEGLIEGKHDIVLKINSQNASKLTTENLRKADVAIEFSTPDAAFNNILKCFEANVPIVVGTTAWLDRLEEITQLCEQQKQALFYASNFSIGVNLFFEFNRKLAKMMADYPNYHLQIDEIHHTQKLDAPSGTAITLAEGIMDVDESKYYDWTNEVSPYEDVIGIVSHRKEDVKGTHVITYSSDIDTIEIKHTAHTRAGFALGAIKAAEWLIEGERKGVFSMKDMLVV